MVFVCCSAARVACDPPQTMISTLRATNSAARASNLALLARASIFDDHVLPLDITEVAQTLPKCIRAQTAKAHR
jgi:hypothetical protein